MPGMEARGERLGWGNSGGMDGSGGLEEGKAGASVVVGNRGVTPVSNGRLPAAAMRLRAE